MKLELKKELPLLLIVAMPFIYLAYVWADLPNKVPLHWNIKGEIDRWGDKQELILIPFLLPLLTYVIFLFVPIIDPKKQLEKMGSKYYNFKFILILFVSLLSIFIIYIAKEQTFNNSIFIFIAIGFLFTIIGNFLKTIRPNYFIGIRTPWTLENEEVWKHTHIMAGKLWFVGGLSIVFFSIILNQIIASKVFVFVLSLLVIIPILYSYFKFKKITRTK